MPGSNFRNDIQKMIEKYVEGTATAEEIAFVESYYEYQKNNEAPELSAQEQESLRKETFNNIHHQINFVPQPVARNFSIIKAASIAAILLIAFTTAYFFSKKSSSNKTPEAYIVKKPLDIAPGSNRATLTLADGSTITLNDKAAGNLKQLPGLLISKTHKGELVYTLSGRPNNHNSILNNTVRTPRGGQYQIYLPDGTHVWLNAASALTYPQSFSGKTRRVQLKGEGYFEVTKNRAMPFHVLTESQDVEVTGTHFNINGYMDNGFINTTLLEGGIIVHNQGNSKKIVPGEQAIVSTNPFTIKVTTVDTDEAVAWKNGLFEFNNASLKLILNQLERWYDIRVDYNNIPEKRYNGMIPRSANLSKVLNMLEVTGNIKFKIEKNRQLKVLPQ
ncbi:FecR family protein [uncultured Mucilaginibacter sp.]|uniref:FecR family protein n=1 Tax=uncultured Mucilaginibacter sp. TaxID=797541 RepID=UPI0025F1637B|nr:FecR family protein [uncultured Mucilaginibacter sp.]